MIGDGYFQLRAQIGTSLYSLASLARDLDASGAALDALHALQARLREPFLFLAVGERGAGKSSLLNALFGRDFASDPLFAGRPVTYRYGAEPREEVRGDGTIEIQRPSIFLRDFTLVEIPAFDPAETWTPLLPAADLMLVVLSAKGDPAAAWAALTPLDRDGLRRCVFVVQQSDAVPAFDLPAIVKRLRHLMLTQLGFACPMFPVSAHTRFGLDKLDRYIDSEVVVSPARCQALRDICDAGRRILTEIGAHSQAAVEAAARRQQRIEEERLALGARRDQSLRLAAGALWSLTRLFDSTQSRAAKLLERKLTLARIWRDKAEWWREFHAEVETRLRDAIARSLAVTFEKFEGDLQAAWKQHRDALRKLHFEPCPPFSHDAAGLFARLTADLTACDQNGAATRAMQRVCARARRRLALPAFAAVAAALLLGGACFTSQFVIAATALTAVTATGFLIVLGMVRRDALGALRRVMAGRRERVLSYFEEELRGEIDRFYRPLAASFHAAAEDAARQDVAHAPTLDRLRQLEELFARCAADIAARKPAAAQEAPL
jgi:hypothetical protein